LCFLGILTAKNRLDGSREVTFQTQLESPLRDPAGSDFNAFSESAGSKIALPCGPPGVGVVGTRSQRSAALQRRAILDGSLREQYRRAVIFMKFRGSQSLIDKSARSGFQWSGPRKD
jgi:hypothetical protein